MKIAILTQPLGHNYGGIMQAYALQKVLSDLGHDVVTIDRRADKINFLKKLLLPFKPIIYKFFLKKVNKPLTQEQIDYIFSEMFGFISKEIRVSEIINSARALKKHYKDHDYDLVIVGSDQVWRPKYSPNIYNFFGDFLPSGSKIIAYAASFGVDDWEFSGAQTRKCRELIKKFNYVTVREKTAVTLCKSNLDVEASLVLDPTLLLTKRNYEKLVLDFNLKGKGKGKVLKYILDNSERKNEIINKVSSILKKGCFCSQPKKELNNIDINQLDDYQFPPVEEWIMSFYDADFVVTDSFHGCVFSIIFNKPFIAIGNHDRGVSRFKSLLSLLGLMDRLVLDKEKDIHEIVSQEINWKSVNSKLSIYRNESYDVLRNMI